MRLENYYKNSNKIICCLHNLSSDFDENKVEIAFFFKPNKAVYKYTKNILTIW